MAKKTKEQALEEMDAQASNAQNDLVNVDQDAVDKVREWWEKWYGKAGHKRLGRVLIGKF